MFKGKVNTEALLVKYGCDELEQQGHKECLRLYRVPNDEDEKNSELLNTVIKSISEGNIVIKEEDSQFATDKAQTSMESNPFW